MIVTQCPAGHMPLSSCHVKDEVQGRDKIFTVMEGSVCQACEMQGRCPGMFSGQGTSWSPLTYRIYHEVSSIRLAQRREYEQTEEFKDRYRIRSGIEATNGSLKRKLGLGRLRVRGKPSVFRAILLKVAGWNMHRASCCAKIQKEVIKRASKAVLCTFSTPFSRISQPQSEAVGPHATIGPDISPYVSEYTKALAALHTSVGGVSLLKPSLLKPPLVSVALTNPISPSIGLPFPGSFPRSPTLSLVLCLIQATA